jgi:hypothetical protein
MQRYLAVYGLALATLVGRPVMAQTPGEADPGVRPTRLIDRAEVRVTRVEIQPGATRRAHQHDDGVYRLWVPIEGQLQLTIWNRRAGCCGIRASVLHEAGDLSRIQEHRHDRRRRSRNLREADDDGRRA